MQKLVALPLYFTHSINLPFIFTIRKGTGKSVTETLISESVHPKYDERLFIELQDKNKL